jgi:hypothetical protein
MSLIKQCSLCNDEFESDFNDKCDECCKKIEEKTPDDGFYFNELSAPNHTDDIICPELIPYFILSYFLCLTVLFIIKLIY